MPTDRLFDHATRLRGARMAIVAFLLGAVRAYPLEAQQPAAPQQPQSAAPGAVLAPYRAPVLALVQPLPGGTVSQDRPSLMFRFAQGEPDDPVDIGSFTVAVDRVDRTQAFQVTGTQAWGSLGDAPSLGLHEVSARVCSMRGACATAIGTVAVLPSPTEAPLSISRKRKVLGAMLDLGKRMLGLPQ